MEPIPESLTNLLTYLAVIAAAISGALEARKHEMDLVGAITVAFVTAFGGGTIRDLLLGRIPIFWVVDAGLSVATFVSAFIAYYRMNSMPGRLFFIPDALGLGFFSVLGTSYALQMNLHPLVSALMGVVTGVFGGILRDIVCNRIPVVFRKNTELYATCAFTGSWVYILLTWLHFDPATCSWAGTLTIVIFRVVAVVFQMRLPQP